MTREQFESLVARLEKFSRAQPRAYETRCALLAVLGYAYLLVILVAVLALIGVLLLALLSRKGPSVWILKGGWVLGVLAFMILRAMWVRLPDPDGLELRREEAPELFRMIDAVRAELKAPPFHHVLLTPEFNAAAGQRPRLGILGWQKNYLLLGLPLMQALTPDEFRSVVAHELGHLSGNHSRFSGWIYRIEASWTQLLSTLQEERHGATWIFERFFNWYVPLFNAYTFVLRRANEFVADRCAAEVAGPAAAAEGLLRVGISGRILGEKYWPSVYEQADRTPEPPDNAFTGMSQALRQPPARDEAVEWLRKSLTEVTEVGDTHPALPDRLTALGYPVVSQDPEEVLRHAPHLLSPPERTAAELFLGPAERELSTRLDRLWKEMIAEQWQERCREAGEARQGLEALEAKVAAGEPLTDEEAWDRARWTADVRTPKEAIPLFREVVARQPDRAEAHYALGALLLGEKDGAGIPYLERAMDLEPDATLAACGAIYEFLKEHGRHEEAKPYRDRAEQRVELLQAAQKERSEVNPSDTFLPHGLPAETVEAIRTQLAGIETLGAAFLVRKQVRHLPEHPMYLLGVSPSTKWFKLRTEGDDQKLLDRVTSTVEAAPEGTLVLIFNDHTTGIRKEVSKVEGAEIYRREGA